MAIRYANCHSVFALLLTCTCSSACSSSCMCDEWNVMKRASVTLEAGQGQLTEHEAEEQPNRLNTYPDRYRRMACPSETRTHQ
ncbi:hypothetical protein HDV57DRAFT_493610 [Trichoderma longibrachiatum]